MLTLRFHYVCVVALFAAGLLIHCGKQTECSFASDCEGGGVCVDGQCKTNTVAQCKKDSDCGALQCSKGFCIPKTPTTETSQDEPNADGGTSDALHPEKDNPGTTPIGSVCSSTKECVPGSVCKVSISGGKPKTLCATSVGKDVGEKCGVSTDCSTGLCLKGVCSSLCLAHQHCAKDQHCVSVPYINQTKVRACLRGKRSTCSSHLDCPVGQRCQASYDQNSNRATTQCRTPKGNDTKPLGATCVPNDFPGVCASHVCDVVTKKCLDVCQPGIPCKTKGFSCQPYAFFGGSIFVCSAPPKTCTKPSDCPDGTSCSLIQKEKERVLFQCVRHHAKQPKKLGEKCNASPTANNQCQTGLCYSEQGNNVGVCVSSCASDEDCKGFKDTPVCGKLTLTKGRFAAACVAKETLCVQDANCPASEPICTLSLFSGKPLFRCQKAGSGTLKKGERCDEKSGYANPCINRFCVRGLNACAVHCSQNEHCSPGQVCRDVFVKNDRHKACVDPVGDRCSDRFGCTHPLTCTAREDNRGGASSVVGVCLNEGGRLYGQECTPPADKGLSRECKTRICHPKAKVCTSVCNTSTDCKVGQCVDMKMRFDNKDVVVKVCDESCIKDKNCPTGQRCSVVSKSQNQMRFVCLPEVAGKKKEGESCDPLLPLDSECASGLCEPISKTCTSHCTADADCSSSQSCTMTYAVVQLPNKSIVRRFVQACVPKAGACISDAQCYNGDVCQVTTRNARSIKRCNRRLPTQKLAGAVCDPTQTAPGGCISGMCDPTQKVCVLHCQTDDDCKSAQGTKCKDVQIASTTFKACLKAK